MQYYKVTSPSQFKDYLLCEMHNLNWSDDNGKGCHIAINTQASSAVELEYLSDGTIRTRSNLKLEVSFGKMEVGSSVLLYQSKKFPKWSRKFLKNKDGTISPRENTSLVLGVDSGRSVILVKKSDASRALRFSDANMKADVKRLLESNQPNRRRLLLLSGKKNQAFPKALSASKSIYHVKKSLGNKFGGRGCQISAIHKNNATIFNFDGPRDNFAVRVHADRDLSLTCDYGSESLGNTLSMWCTDGHPEWAMKFCFNSSNQISLADRFDLVLGLREKDMKIVLVKPEDKNAIVFQDEASQEKSLQRLDQELIQREKDLQMMKMHALKIVKDSTFRNSLEENGFVRVSNLVPEELVLNARREINRMLGQSSKSPDTFKAKTFASHPAITDLINRSGVPQLLSEMLGPHSYVVSTFSYPSLAITPTLEHGYDQGSGQIALRFPGDMCEDKTSCTSSPANFNNLRKYWHIDGCANPFIPGVTDHYGEIHNFDVLVGVLLSDIHEKNSGELCCYTGSHHELAKYFGSKDRIKELKKKGNVALPTKESTDKVLKGKVWHGVGKAGDVFLANYMTAHFIAPNTSPNIRYAVYFRIKGPNFGTPSNEASMLRPLKNWFKKSSSTSAMSSKVSREVAVRLEKLQYSSNDHTVPERMR